MNRKLKLKAVSAVSILLILAGCNSHVQPDETGQNETETVVIEDNGEKENVVLQDYGSLALSESQVVEQGRYIATAIDESALEVSEDAEVTISDSELVKASGAASSADASSFEGVNAGIRVYDSAVLTIDNCIINAEADNATGVFAYDEGTIYINDSSVNVTGGGAGGIQVAGGGTLIGNNLTVTSKSKAAIRSDKGGGIMILDGGVYTSLGSNGCPAIYSTADITVRNATCVSENSRAVIIEGKNTVTLENCILTGNDKSTKTGSIKANVLLYQSASGDAREGTSVFSMTSGQMTSLSGAMFYCTNTSSKVYLNNAELVLSEDGTLLIVSAGRWGKDGSNGGKCEFTAENQQLNGDITVDSISTLKLELVSSNYTGCISCEGSTSVTLDANSTWILTGDSHISEFNGSYDNVITNGYKLYVGGEAVLG